MTLVASYARSDGNVWMVADSHSFGESRVYPLTKKIQRRQIFWADNEPAGEILLGSCGAHMVTYLARNAELPLFERSCEPIDIVDGITDALQRFAKEQAIQMTADKQEQQWHIAWNGHVWSTTSYDVCEIDGYDAMGAGGTLALGALEILARDCRIAPNPEVGLLEAASAAAKWSHLVKPPWQVELLRPLS